MDIVQGLDIVIKLVVLVAGAVWAVCKWRRREEHFPRIALDVQARFIEADPGRPWVLEIVATIENKGLVPIKIKDFGFSLRVLRKADKWIWNTKARRGQLDFGDESLAEKFVTASMGYTFVSPSVRTEYTYVTALEPDVELIRINADFLYPTRGETHHAARVFAVPKRMAGGGAAPASGVAAVSGKSQGLSGKNSMRGTRRRSEYGQTRSGNAAGLNRTGCLGSVIPGRWRFGSRKPLSSLG